MYLRKYNFSFYVIESVSIILFCNIVQRLSFQYMFIPYGKLHSNFVEPRSCWNSCWPLPLISMGYLQRWSSGKDDFIILRIPFNLLIYSIYLQPKLHVYPISNVIDSRTLRSYCGGRGNNALQVNYQGFDWQGTTIFQCYWLIYCNISRRRR